MNSKMMLFLLIAVCFVSKIQSFAHDLPHFVAGNMHSIAAAFHINSFQIASEGVGNTLLSLLDLPKLPPIPDIELPQIPAIELPQIEVDAILPAVSNAGAKLGSDLGKSGEILTGNTLGGIKNVANAVNEISSGIQTIGVPKTQEYFSKLTDAVKVVPDIDLKATLPDLDKVQNDALAWKLFPDNHMETGYWENKIKAIQNAKADDFANPLGRAVDNFGKRWNEKIASSPIGNINKISIDKEAYDRLLNEAAQTYTNNIKSIQEANK